MTTLLENRSNTCPRCGAPFGVHAQFGFCSRCVATVSFTETGEAQPSEDELAAVLPRTAAISGSRPRFGDYELLEEIARGGMGVVYRARQRSLNRIVAVKMLLFGGLAGSDRLRRFQNEAAAAAALEHANIVRVLDVGEHEGQPFIAMEFITGTDLARLVRERPLPARQAAGYVEKIARAIEFAHQRGVLHRDLKPSNVLLDAFDEPRVTDFGLAKQFGVPPSGGPGPAEAGTPSEDLTLTGFAIGSPNFMPPEQAIGDLRRIGPASDVYGLGAILYHLLTARPPFLAETFEATLTAVRERDPVPLRQLNEKVPRDLETICLKCLEKEPAKRYATAQELADELGRFLNDEPIHARPVTRTERVWRWCRRKPALAASLALALLLLLTVSIGSPIAAYRINKANQQAQANLQAQEREQYYANIRLSDLYVREGNTDRALDLLLQCPPQFRNWEWGYLVYQCHQSFLTIPAHTNRSPNDVYQQQNRLHWLAFSPDASRLVTLGADGFVKVWSTEDGQPLFAFGGTTNWVMNYSWDREARRLAVSCTNGVAHVFDTQTWQEIRVVQHGTKPVRRASINADGRKLSTMDDDGAVQVWNVDSGEQLLRLAPRGPNLGAPASLPANFTPAEMPALPGEPLQSVHFDPSGERLVTKFADKVIVWDASSGAEISRIDPERRLHPGSAGVSPARAPFDIAGETPALPERASTPIVTSSANRDGTLLVTFDANAHTTLWRADGTSAELGDLKAIRPRGVSWAAFSEDNRFLCTGGEFGTARVWDIAAGRELLAIPNRVNGARFSKDGSKLITVGTENVARVWDIKSGREHLTLRGQASLVSHATLSPDGLLAATAGMNGIVKLWSASTGREVIRNDLWTWPLGYSRDGRRIVSGSTSLDLRVSDAENGEELLRLRPDMDYTGGVAFSPDGRFLATGGTDGAVRIWNSATGHETRSMRGHSDLVWCVNFNPDGRQIASASL